MNKILLSLLLLVPGSVTCGPIAGLVAYWVMKGTIYGSLATVSGAAVVASGGIAGPAVVGAGTAVTIIGGAAAFEASSAAVASVFAAIPFLP